jgi:predicted dienelactone hydrolase
MGQAHGDHPLEENGMIRRIAIGIFAVVAVAVGTGAIALVLTAPERPPAESESARRLEAGPFPVGERDYPFVDASRSTMANGEAPARASRELDALLWYPEGDASPHPLVVYSHGFMSTRQEGRMIGEALASRGYVVVSADYPLTHFGTPGGPNVADFRNQPADLRFLVDSVLALSGPDKPFEGSIDTERIGAVGLSLGGLTTTLAAFHPELRDPRIRAAVSIAGPASFFGPRFFETTDIPFLMIAGTGDAMVDYESHARPVLERVPKAGLVTVTEGSHTGFASIADPLFRFVDNPDSVGCGALMENLDIDPEENHFDGLGGAAQGILEDEAAVLPCQGELARAAHPGRQLMITQLAVGDFFESVFAREATARAAARRHLEQGIAHDFVEARYERAHDAPPRGARRAGPVRTPEPG